jgi:hypothetical protein
MTECHQFINRAGKLISGKGNRPKPESDFSNYCLSIEAPSKGLNPMRILSLSMILPHVRRAMLRIMPFGEPGSKKDWLPSGESVRLHTKIRRISI